MLASINVYLSGILGSDFRDTVENIEIVMVMVFPQNRQICMLHPI